LGVGSGDAVGLGRRWDLQIGVCSYLLIGYYSHRLTAIKSAQKAILVNRVSDGMLLWGVLWIWYYTGSLEYDLVLLNETSSISMFIVLSVLVGAMGKSAQILFHVWLADAMEGTALSAFVWTYIIWFGLAETTAKSNLVSAFKVQMVGNYSASPNPRQGPPLGPSLKLAICRDLQ
jgi:formate hydrogenlyase subunit 3/multisubunit Na+/H+ antiporter MnhD subunit